MFDLSSVDAQGDTRSSTGTADRAGWLDRLVRTLNGVNAAVPVGALVLYWIVRSGYESFYERFGITPEQVGINQAAMISRTAYAFGAVLLATAGLWALLLVAFGPAGCATWRSYLTAAVLLGAFGVVIGSRANSWWWIGVFPFMLALACGFRSRLLRNVERLGQPGLFARLGAWFTRQRARYPGLFQVPVTVLVALVLLAASTAWEAARTEAWAEIDGALRGQPRQAPLVALSLLGVRVESVEIVWLTHDVPDRYRHLREALYLGQANGSAFFYDHECGRLVEVPTGSFALLRPPSPQAPAPATTQPATTTTGPPLPPAAAAKASQPGRTSQGAAHHDRARAVAC